MSRAHVDAQARSESLWLAAYFLSRRTQPNGSAPSALGVGTWKEAYARFYSACGDGRSAPQFANTLKNARDSFDSHLSQSRVGWRADGQLPSPLGVIPKAIMAAWGSRTDAELDAAALSLLFESSVRELLQVPQIVASDRIRPLASGVVLREGPADAAEFVLGLPGLRRSAESKLIGDMAEVLVRAYLEASLNDVERQTIVHHAAIGETPGYDISFQRQGRTHGVEVKGTVLEAMLDFEMTSNEWRAAERLGECYELYLVAGVGSSGPRVQVIRDPTLQERVGGLRRTPTAWKVTRIRD